MEPEDEDGVFGQNYEVDFSPQEYHDYDWRPKHYSALPTVPVEGLRVVSRVWPVFADPSEEVGG